VTTVVLNEFVVDAGNHERSWCPVSLVVDKKLPDSGLGQLVEVDTGRVVPCDCDLTEDGTKLRWVVRHLGNREQLRYRFEQITEPTPLPAGHGVHLEAAGEDCIDISVGGERVTAYHFSNSLARPFLHPLIGPYGTSITRDWPMVEGVADETTDHVHHKSVWTAHGDVNGADNWSEEEGHGRTVHIEILTQRSGRGHGIIVSRNSWQTASGEELLEEEHTTSVHALPREMRLIDSICRLRMTKGAVRFGDTKEGGMASVRVASSMLVPRGGKIENSYGGVYESETWGKRAQWCDYSGDVEDRRVGIAIFDHPRNFRHPTYWHVRDYGLMTANCFGISFFDPESGIDGSAEFEAGQEVVFRYRFYVHPGDAALADVAAKYHDYANPPTIELV